MIGIWELWKEQEGEESEETDHPDGMPPTQPLSFTFTRLLFTFSFQFYRPALSCSARVTPPFPFTLSLVFYFSIDKLFPRRPANLVRGVQASQPSPSWGCFRLSDCVPHLPLIQPLVTVASSLLSPLLSPPPLYLSVLSNHTLTLFPTHLHLRILACTVLSLSLYFLEC